MYKKKIWSMKINVFWDVTEVDWSIDIASQKTWIFIITSL